MTVMPTRSRSVVVNMCVTATENRSWDNSDNEKSGRVKHTLSIGHRGCGLPLHFRDKQWIGLIEGAVTW